MAAPPAEEPVVDGATTIARPRVDLWYDEAWHDITADVRYLGDGGQAIQIDRGRANEQATIGPSRCSLTVDNRTGAYSPRKPAGTLYGKIGRNTPLRVVVPILTDAFGRTSASGWGDADTGQSWTALGGDAVDYTVASGKGTLTTTVVSDVHRVYAAAVQRKEITVAGTIKPGVVATGDTIQISVMARRVDANNYYLATMVFDTDATFDLVLTKVVSGSATVINSLTGVSSYGASTEFRVEFTVVGDYLQFRVGDIANPTTVVAELADYDTAIDDAGSAGFTFATGASLSNTLPLSITIDNVAVDDPRFCGEVPAWPPRWDKSGSDVWTPLEAAGIMRRLGAGRVLRSAITRSLPLWSGSDIAAGTLRGYWPCEDQAGSTAAASYIAGRPPMTMFGTVTFADSSGPDGSDSLPSISSGTARLTGAVSPHTVATGGGWWVTLAFRGTAAASPSINILEVQAAGGLPVWRVALNDTSVVATAIDEDGAAQITTTATAACLDDSWHWIMLEAYQATSTQVSAIVYVDTTATASASDTPWTLGAAHTIRMPGPIAPANITTAWGGHVSVWSESSTQAVSNLYSNGSHAAALRGHAGETAGARMRRLAGEEALPLALVGLAADTSPVGAQRIASLLDLLQDAATADGGILYEPRSILGLAYRTRANLYNQTATLALTYTSDHLSEVPDPTDDDQLLRNDVTASRPGGSSYRHTVTSGPLSTSAPPDGVGVYDDAVSVYVQSDVQLPGVAQWLAHLGTWDEARYPRLDVALHRAPFLASAFLTDDAAIVDLGDLVTVASPPAWLPPDTIKVLVQGCSERLDQFQRHLGWNCTPAGPWTVGVLDDSTLGLLGSDGSTTSASFTSGTDTSMSVAVATGYPLWTTGSVTFDIMVAGARLSVTNISGASSPQTFTITQTPVNGVSKTIPSGSTVDLFTRAYIGL